jgi:type II secretion system protein N
VRRLAVAAVVLVAFVAGLLVSIPSDFLVARLRARLPPRVALAVERIGSARLGFGGLTVRDVSLRPRAEAPPIAVDWASFRPSLIGLLTGRGGRPWQVHARACGGEWSGTLDGAPPRDAITLAFRAVDLATCLAPLALTSPLVGTASGDADLTMDGQLVTGQGSVALERARWSLRDWPANLAPEADAATWRWIFDERALRIEDFGMSNRTMGASGAGQLNFPAFEGTPELDFRIRVQPTAAMLQGHRDLFRKLLGSPPEADGARTFHIGGPLDAPVLGMP